MRYSDRPICTPADDLLGRAAFALEIARAIDRLEVAKDGFVIALEGEWGAGKTSVVELVIRYLAHIEMVRLSQTPLYGDTNFVPLTLQELEQLAVSYDRVRERANAYEEEDFGIESWNHQARRGLFRTSLGSENAADDAEAYWELRQRFRDSQRTIVVRFSPWLIAGRAELAIALLSELARALGSGLGPGAKQSFAALIARLTELAPVAGAGVDLAGGSGIGKLLSASARVAQRYANRMSTGPTLDELRLRLRAQLRRLDGRQILLVVDDLDRLTPAEAVEMVTLVKSLGDLPNVVYLLIFDADKMHPLVGKGLNAGVLVDNVDQFRSDGRNFLEKIIQYSIHLPLIPEDDISTLLDADLGRLFPALSDEDKRRLGMAWYFVLRQYLKNPRDVRRFVNALAVVHSALHDYTDPIDLILIETLRLYDQEVYWWIRQNLAELVQ